MMRPLPPVTAVACVDHDVATHGSYERRDVILQRRDLDRRQGSDGQDKFAALIDAQSEW